MPKLSKADREFIEFLKGTLIPDLKESGREYTAKDFEHCIRIIKKLAGES